MSPAAHASDATVMGSVTQKIARIMTAPDTVNAAAVPNASFVSFCAPGVAITGSDLAFGDMTTKPEIDASSAFSQLVNSIPSSTAFWSPTGTKIWDVYEDAITQVTLPVITLTPHQQSELDTAQAFLTQRVTRTDPVTGARMQVVQDTPQYAAYKRYQTAYTAALASCNGMEIQANSPGASNALVQDWARNGAAYRSQVTSANGSWVADGYKDDVEAALGIIGNLAGQGPGALYQTLRADFAAGRLTDTRGQTFYPTSVYPADPLMPALKASWTSYEFNLQDVQTFRSDARGNSGGSAGAGWGLFCSGAPARYGSGQSSYPCDTTGLIVQAELLQVPLHRAWLRPEIFWSHGWRWSPSAGFGPISDGGSPPQGLMPLYPTAVILSQNVMINLDMTAQQNESSWSSISASASFGWGPFSIGGNDSHLRTSAESHFTQSSGGISIPGPQIIAFVCDVLPKSPAPDPGLPWPAS
jgi:hypothetical protein